MQIISPPYSKPIQGVVATIGFFDGVHRGHRWLIERIDKRAQQQQLASAVITFRRHPREVLQHTFCPQMIDTLDEKLNKLAQTPLDYCLLLDFDLEMSKLSSFEFLQFLKEQLGVEQLLVGHDHRFGHNRNEGIADYIEHGKVLGIEVIQAPVYAPDGLHISSSTIRKQIEKHQIKEANQLLGSTFTLSGKVVLGKQIGRKIGFPTANIEIANPHKIIPSRGCYAVNATIEGENIVRKGMMNVGTQPTITNQPTHHRIEVNIFDFEGNLYDKTLSIEVVDFLREERKMSGLDELTQQLQKDKEQAKRLLL